MSATPSPTWDIMKRRDAALAGRKRYFTGRPCKHDHLAQRYTSTGTCVSCGDKNNRHYRQLLKGGGPDTVEIKVQVHKDDVEGIKLHIAAVAQARHLVSGAPPGLCPHGCRSDQFCQPCDIGQ